MISKCIFSILCVILLTNENFIARGQRCPFLGNRARGQRKSLQNAGNDKCDLTDRPRCNRNDVFYSLDGSCNNLRIPNWGRAGTTFVRLLRANYSDGFSKIRTSMDGSLLPLPRRLTVSFLRDQNIRSNRLNVWFYGFGQFVDHDVTLSSEISIDSNKCCLNNKPVRDRSGKCLPIIVPRNDDFYKQFGVTCLPIKRVINTNDGDHRCNIRPIFQINSQTAFLDLSVLYGADRKTLSKQRSRRGGKLRIQNDRSTGNQEFPPRFSPNDCKFKLGGVDRGPRGECFMSGDERINQNPEILLADIVFLRLHNRIAEGLQAVNPRWNDEKLFKEARRICIAMYQHVIYAEYLPVLLGSRIADLYKLFPASSGYVRGYDDDLNPQTLGSYAAAAARAGHSNVVGSMSFTGSNGRSESYRLRDIYFKNKFLLGRNMFKNLLEKYLGQTCSEQDQFTSPDLNNWVFFNIDRKFGFDLSAVDILRGRDFGLQPYNKYRAACGLCQVNRFEDLARDFKRPEEISRLRSLYRSVDDIDYFVGGQLEKPLPGGTLGQSFACIQAESFFRWKFGDRLFYEFPTARFTTSQLNSIRTTTMSGILCLTNPSTRSIQRNSFLVESSRNPRVQCNQLPRINFNLWKERNGGRSDN